MGCKVVSDLYLLVPAVHLSLQNVDDLRFTQQHLLLLVELLLQSLQELTRGPRTGVRQQLRQGSHTVLRTNLMQSVISFKSVTGKDDASSSRGNTGGGKFA